MTISAIPAAAQSFASTARFGSGHAVQRIEDEGLLKELTDRVINVDTNRYSEAEWAGVIEQKLKGAEIVLLLISADFPIRITATT